jgi:phage replication-related protein YjqB (UPF0714/DUF867 family)
MYTADCTLILYTYPKQPSTTYGNGRQRKQHKNIPRAVAARGYESAALTVELRAIGLRKSLS